MPKSPKPVKARYREKMIEVRIRFWTDEIADKEGYIVPKHAWTSGVVRMERNLSHGIESEIPKHFNSLMEIPSVIEKVLIQHGVVLRRLRHMSKYIE